MTYDSAVSVEKFHPLKVTLQKKEKILTISFDDGHEFSYSAEYLRIKTPCLEPQGHGSSQQTIIPGRRNVGINHIESLGNYAIRIHFDDDHNTGIYSWSYLHQLGLKQHENWHRYLEMLKNLGLTR